MNRHDSRNLSAVQSTIARTILARDPRGTLVGAESRKKGAENTHLSSALSPQTSLPLLTTQELTREVQCVVLHFPTQEIVDDTQASLRAIENTRNGTSGMSLKTFVNLCRANPKARALVGPLLGYGCESDPEVVGAISTLLNSLVREPRTDEAPTRAAPVTANADDTTPGIGGDDLFGGRA